MNNLTYVPQNVPTLMTVLSAGKDATNPLIYGANSIPQILNHNDIVEVVVNNFDDGGHPIHMHGHNFQMVERPQAGAGVYSGSTKNPPAVPIRRDVIKVNGNSYLVYRFKADNPGMCLPRNVSYRRILLISLMQASGLSTVTSTGISKVCSTLPSN